MSWDDPTEAEWLEGNDPMTTRERFEDATGHPMTTEKGKTMSTTELVAAARKRAQTDSPVHELLKQLADALEAVTTPTSPAKAWLEGAEHVASRHPGYIGWDEEENPYETGPEPVTTPTEADREEIAAILWESRREELTWERAQEVARRRGVPPSSLAVAQTWRAADAILARVGHPQPETVEAKADLPSATEIAKTFHESYERLAPDFGYKTREESVVPWDDVPDHNKLLMVATAHDVLALLQGGE